MSLLLQTLGAGGIAAIFASVLNAVINRKRLGAQTEDITATATRRLQETASALAESYRTTNDELRAEVRALRAEAVQTNDLASQLARKVITLERHVQAWEQWAEGVLEESKPFGVDLPAPPHLGDKK